MTEKDPLEVFEEHVVGSIKDVEETADESAKYFLAVDPHVSEDDGNAHAHALARAFVLYGALWVASETTVLQGAAIEKRLKRNRWAYRFTLAASLAANVGAYYG